MCYIVLKGDAVGRLKEFEDKKALEKAMLLFWEKGYENTSLKDLLQEMNILNGSFYNSFGNKKKLLIKTLEHYGQEVTAKRAQTLMSKSTFREGIRAVFSEMMDHIEQETLPKGCLLANTLTNDLLRDPEVKVFVLAEMQKFESFFEAHILKAQKAGELDEEIDPKVTASIIVAYLQGVMRLSCLKFSSAQIQRQNEAFFKSLGV